MGLVHRTVVRRHSVPILEGGISPMQTAILKSRSLINVVSAPTGAGKSYAFRKGVINGERILFIVSTKRLGENQQMSMIADLIDPDLAEKEGRKPWPEALARRKVQNWNSDFLDKALAAGFHNCFDYYTANFGQLDHRAGGEIVYCTPETLGNIFMRCTKSGATGDMGVAAAVNWFDRIVYDEFHTIHEKGFGLVTTIAATARAWAAESNVPRKSSVFLLSATPVDISKTLTQMGFDVTDPDEVRFIREELTDGPGRVLHGDVVLEFHSGQSPVSYASTTPFGQQLGPKSKAVIIYDSLRKMKEEEPQLTEMFRDNSILFESGLHSQIESETSGKSRSLDSATVIVGTSSIEMGVTIPHAVHMITDAGFNPMSLLQRIGRAARGDIEGHVTVVYSSIGSRPWLLEIIERLAPLGDNVSVEELTGVFASAAKVSERMDAGDECTISLIQTFGTLGNRATYCCALYQYVLARKLTMNGNVHYARRLRDIAAGNAKGKLIHALCKTLEGSATGKKWLAAFLASAENLRDFAPTIRVTSDRGEFTYSEYWLRKNTDILEAHVVEFDHKGDAFVRVDNIDFTICEDRKSIQDTRIILLPNGESRSVPSSSARSDFVNLCSGLLANRMEKKIYEAASRLVSLTGVLPYGDDNVAP